MSLAKYFEALLLMPYFLPSFYLLPPARSLSLPSVCLISKVVFDEAKLLDRADSEVHPAVAGWATCFSSFSASSSSALNSMP